MSWQPSQVATNRALLGPSGHSFWVYWAWAAGAPSAKTNDNTVSAAVRMPSSPRPGSIQARLRCAQPRRGDGIRQGFPVQSLLNVRQQPGSSPCADVEGL